MQGSQRQLTHLGREQVRLLNRWTRAMAHRVALESDSPTATTAPVTLAAAEAPFADPFLMEFEDSEALRSAYTETPMTFEQALMTARLEAKMATQVRRSSYDICRGLIALAPPMQGLSEHCSKPPYQPSWQPVMQCSGAFS